MDSDIAADLVGQNARRLMRPHSALGGQLQGFVANRVRAVFISGLWSVSGDGPVEAGD